MQPSNRETLLSCFKKVPHKGLAEIVRSLDGFGVLTDLSAWDLRVTGDFPYAYYRMHVQHQLAVGVSRRPLVGCQSWCAVTDGLYGERRPALIRVVLNEDDARCSLEFEPDMSGVPSEKFRVLRDAFFAPNVAEVPLERDRIRALLERFVELVDSQPFLRS